MQSTEFNTDKSGLYDLLVRFRNHKAGVGDNIDITGVKNVNLDIPAESADAPQNGTVFGYTIETTNFMMHGASSFEALQTGDYTFSIEASDAALLVIVADMSPYCCANMDDPDFLDILEDGAKYIIDLPSDPDHSNGTLTVSMKEGVEYIMEFVYINWSGDAHFTFTVTNPDGETTSDFTGYAGQVGDPECDNVHTTSRSYSEWSLDYSTTYSSTIITVDQTTTTTLETVYYVITPIPEELSVMETTSSSIIPSSATGGEVSLTSLDISYITSSLSSESEPTLSWSDDPSTLSSVSSFDEDTSSGSELTSSSSEDESTLTTTLSFNDETSRLSEYSTSEEFHSSSEFSSTQGASVSSMNSRSVFSESPSTPTNTDDAISRSHEKSTDLTSVDSSMSATQTSSPTLTTSETGSVTGWASSVDVTSSLTSTLFFGNSSSLATGELATSSNIDGSSTAGEAQTTDIGDEYTSVSHTNIKYTSLSTEDNWKISNTNQNSVLTRETSFTVITTNTSSTNDDQVSETNKATHPSNTPTGKYGGNDGKPKGDGNYGPVNTKSLAESPSNVVPDVTQAIPSKTTTPAISGSSNNPVVSVYAVKTVNLGSRLCIKAISILLPLLLSI
ncbi:hypothetical protein DAKH74_046790 [Maudiozyma humilis]|uniref:PA14 domain-containing protein n=1 Tax=Maudiozyma humilis TaxID=51915 RepID=A0AAV5S5B8_MAUHU|nr:hypothetical protein DAKH74_046790 [Kazachstania humilis]